MLYKIELSIELYKPTIRIKMSPPKIKKYKQKQTKAKITQKAGQAQTFFTNEWHECDIPTQFITIRKIVTDQHVE